MNIPFGDLRRQTESQAEELRAAAERVIASGWYIHGPEVKAFEEAFAAYCGTSEAIGVANGTEAIQLALLALGAGAGNEVITVANAGVPGPAAIRQTGATPVYVDVDPETHTLDPALLEQAIGPNTVAILPVHLYGRPAELGPIMEIAARHGLPVVEDCAQAHGARYQRERVGSIGVMGCFSFYPTKNLGALGDGGMITTSDAQLATKLRQLRQYGWERRYYSTVAGGTNSRLDEIQAALLRVKLIKLDEWNNARQHIAAEYARTLAGGPWTLPSAPEDGEHVYHLYVVRTAERENLMAALREQGIGTDVHYPLPAHLQPAFADERFPEGSLPITERLAHEVLSLPCYPELTGPELAEIASAMIKYQERHSG